MLRIFKTLIIGTNARAEDRMKDGFAIELIDQKIRETESQLKAAKATLASLVQCQRSEKRLSDALATRIKTMTMRNCWRIMWARGRTIADYCKTCGKRHFVKNASPHPGGGWHF